MKFDLSTVVKGSLSVNCDDFMNLVSSVIEQLRKEKGRMGYLTINERLVTLEPVGEALIIGDLHGDLESLHEILQKSRYLPKMVKKKDRFLMFLGDYGDRGVRSAEVYYTILQLKQAFPEQTILLRGNHEGPKDLLAVPHDLPLQFQFRFKEKWVDAYKKIRELFDYLYNAVLVKGRYLIVHGGLSSQISSASDATQLCVKLAGKDFLEPLLWSDPVDSIRDVSASPRGAGELFSKNVTKTVLGELGVKILIRGHEPANDGYKIDHDGKVLTLFSRKGPPYFNKHAAYLNVPLYRKFEDARQLVPWICRF